MNLGSLIRYLHYHPSRDIVYVTRVEYGEIGCGYFVRVAIPPVLSMKLETLSWDRPNVHIREVKIRVTRLDEIHGLKLSEAINVFFDLHLPTDFIPAYFDLLLKHVRPIIDIDKDMRATPVLWRNAIIEKLEAL